LAVPRQGLARAGVGEAVDGAGHAVVRLLVKAEQVLDAGTRRRETYA
jgi:hypothetical protein